MVLAPALIFFFLDNLPWKFEWKWNIFVLEVTCAPSLMSVFSDFLHKNYCHYMLMIMICFMLYEFPNIKTAKTLLYHNKCNALGLRSRWEMDCFEHCMMCESGLFSTLLKRTMQHLQIIYIARTALSISFVNYSFIHRLLHENNRIEDVVDCSINIHRNYHQTHQLMWNIDIRLVPCLEVFHICKI